MRHENQAEHQLPFSGTIHDEIVIHHQKVNGAQLLAYCLLNESRSCQTPEKIGRAKRR
jgi:hypothetical protein